MQKYLLNNPHSLLLVMEPKPGLEKEISAKTDRELQEFNAALAAKEKEALVKETRDLIAYQKSEDSPEALATIPLLERKDIDPQAPWFSTQERNISGVPVLHHEEFANDVVYTKLLFDARVLPVELIPYAALLTEILGSQNTENYSYGDLDVALSIS